jgi:hypothetical protein
MPLAGNKSVLKFNLLSESASVLSPTSNSPLRLLNLLNSKEWMGKKPGSCRVVDFKQDKPVPLGKTAMMDHAEFLLFVGYRPNGWISDVKDDGRQRLNGWNLEVRDQKNDGTLLDGHGQPLPPGAEAVYLRFEMCHLVDFNDYEFGHFLCEDVGDGPLSNEGSAVTRKKMQVTESKTDCQIRSGDQSLNAMLHLIEIRYSERIVFWNGIFQITRDEMSRLGDVGKRPVFVTLPDGRTGALHISYGNATSDYFEFAGAGQPN